MLSNSVLCRPQQQPSSLNQSLAALDKPLVIEDYYCVAVKQQLHSSRRHSHSSSDDTTAAADATTIDGGNSDAVDDAADSSSTAATTTATADDATAEATKPAVKLVTALTPPRSPVYEGEDGAARWLVNTHSPPHSRSSAYGSSAAAAAAAAAAGGNTLQNSTLQLLQQMEACGDSDTDSDDGATASSTAGMSASVFGRYGLGRFALPKPIDIELEPVAVTGSSSTGISKFAASTELQQQGGSDSLYDFTSTAAAAVTATATAAAASAATGTTVAAAAPSLVMPFMNFNQSSAGLQRAGEASASAATTGVFSAGFTSSDVIAQQQQQEQLYRFDEHTQSQHEQLLLDLARSNSSSIDSRSSSDSVDGFAGGEHDLLPFGAVNGLAAATAGTIAMQQQLADIAAMDWLTGVQSDALHSSQLAQAVTATSTAGLFDGAAEGSSTAADTATPADTTVDASAGLASTYCSDPFAELTAQLQQQQQQVDETTAAVAAAAISTATTAAEAAGGVNASSGEASSATIALPVACLIDTSEPAAELGTAAISQQELPFAGTL
jgi:hypothetical protein